MPRAESDFAGHTAQPLPEPESPLNDGEPLPRSWVVALCVVALLVPVCFAAMVSLFPKDNLEEATEVATEMIVKVVLGLGKLRVGFGHWAPPRFSCLKALDFLASALKQCPWVLLGGANGNASDTLGTVNFSAATTTPEPSSLMMLLAGTAVLAMSLLWRGFQGTLRSRVR